MNLDRYLLRLVNFLLLQWIGVRFGIATREGDGKLVGIFFQYDVLPLTGWWDAYEPILGPTIERKDWRWNHDE